MNATITFKDGKVEIVGDVYRVIRGGELKTILVLQGGGVKIFHKVKEITLLF